MAEALITVLIPTYNHQSYVCAAIESVIRQSVFDECRVIVSDDCSADLTLDAAREASRNKDNIVVRRNASNLGVMRHYAKLVSEVSTPYVAILEGDDCWISDQKLQLQRKVLEDYPRAGMCFSACLVENEATGERSEHPPWHRGRNRFVNIIDLIYDNPIATFSNCFYRTESLARALSWPDSVVGYDWLCNLRIAMTEDVILLAHTSTLYRIHPEGTWSKMTRRQRKVAIRRTLECVQGMAPQELKLYVADAIRAVA